MSEEQQINDWFVNQYAVVVEQAYPEQAKQWPLVSSFGHSVDIGVIGTTSILIFKNDSGGLRSYNGIGNISQKFGVETITEDNREAVRSNIMNHYSLPPRGAVVFIDDNLDWTVELQSQLSRHAIALGISPMKVFLSHKGANKEMVRQFDKLLRTMGYETWLDEDCMPAGVNLHRGIAEGFYQSCAAVFFITKEFKDETYLANEIDLAMARHNEDGERFRIITLLFDEEAVVPTLLKRFVWKSPTNALDAATEIIRALPIETGVVRSRQ